MTRPSDKVTLERAIAAIAPWTTADSRSDSPIVGMFVYFPRQNRLEIGHIEPDTRKFCQDPKNDNTIFSRFPSLLRELESISRQIISTFQKLGTLADRLAPGTSDQITRKGSLFVKYNDREKLPAPVATRFGFRSAVTGEEV